MTKRLLAWIRVGSEAFFLEEGDRPTWKAEPGIEPPVYRRAPWLDEPGAIYNARRDGDHEDPAVERSRFRAELGAALSGNLGFPSREDPALKISCPQCSSLPGFWCGPDQSLWLIHNERRVEARQGPILQPGLACCFRCGVSHPGQFCASADLAFADRIARDSPGWRPTEAELKANRDAD